MSDSKTWKHRVAWVAGALVLQVLAVLLYLRIERVREIERAPALHYEHLANQPVMDLRLRRADGTVLQLSELRGRFVLLHFWATWCPPCREELPALIEASGQLARERPISLVAVSVDRDWAILRDYFAGEIPREVYRDDANPASDRDISTLPETFLLNPDGRPALRFAGSREWRAPAALALLRDQTSR